MDNIGYIETSIKDNYDGVVFNFQTVTNLTNPNAAIWDFLIYTTNFCGLLKKNNPKLEIIVVVNKGGWELGLFTDLYKYVGKGIDILSSNQETLQPYNLTLGY